MQTYHVKLKDKYPVADQTVAFVFEKPAGFQFMAGQYIAMSLPRLDFEDARGPHRSFSIASAPFDPDLLFTMRITESGFKKTMAAMPQGGEIIIRDAVGQFVLPEDQTQTIVFLAGGIGITPVRSILRQAAVDKRANPFWLFFSNRQPKDAPFVEAMQDFPELNYRCIDTLTDHEGECSWQEESGFICSDMLKKYLHDVQAPLYYLVGTVGFVEAMKKILVEELGVEATQIKVDPFTGL